MTTKNPSPPEFPEYTHSASLDTPPQPPVVTVWHCADDTEAIQVEIGLRGLRAAVAKLNRCKQSWDDIELAFFEAMKQEFGK